MRRIKTSVPLIMCLKSRETDLEAAEKTNGIDQLEHTDNTTRDTAVSSFSHLLHACEDYPQPQLKVSAMYRGSKCLSQTAEFSCCQLGRGSY